MKEQYHRVINTIGVFCGSSVGAGNLYLREAEKLGHLLADEGVAMVYGGGNIGLMGVVANAMLAHGGKVTGVIPEQLLSRELAHEGVQDMRIVSGMSARKELIGQLSDAFIAMPGGYGTMDEFFEMLTQFQLGISDKPCGLLNANGFYDPLVMQLDLFVRERFLSEMHRANLLVESSPSALLYAIRNAPVHDHEDHSWIKSLKITNRY